MNQQKRVMALGFFDGVHLGHAALMEKTLEQAEKCGFKPAVLSFDIHPDLLVFGKNVSLINSAEERKRYIGSRFGISDVIFLRFTEDLMKMEWDNFLELLVSRFNVGHLVCGHDFTFGYKGMGNAGRLKEYCTAKGLGCDVIPPVYEKGEIISSTCIRECIQSGRISKANELLGHPHFLSGTVIHGLHNGEKLGFPTVNLKMPEGRIVPAFGVYASVVTTEGGERFMAATDIGVKPTVCDDASVLVESHLFDFNEDIYGEKITVELMEFIRPEKRFSSLAELSAGIEKDVRDIKAWFNR